jgi:hypothetical protein
VGTTSEAVAEALSDVLQDAERTGAPLPRIVVTDDLVMLHAADGSGTGIWAGPEDESDAERRPLPAGRR